MAWSTDAKFPYYVSYIGGSNTLWKWQIGTNTSEKVADLVKGEVISLSVVGDGTVVYVDGERRNNIMLLNGLG